MNLIHIKTLSQIMERLPHPSKVDTYTLHVDFIQPPTAIYEPRNAPETPQRSQKLTFVRVGWDEWALSIP